MIKFLQVFLLTALVLAVAFSAFAVSTIYGGIIGFFSVYIVLMAAAVSAMYCLWGR